MGTFQPFISSIRIEEGWDSESLQFISFLPKKQKIHISQIFIIFAGQMQNDWNHLDLKMTRSLVKNPDYIGDGDGFNKVRPEPILINWVK